MPPWASTWKMKWKPESGQRHKKRQGKIFRPRLWKPVLGVFIPQISKHKRLWQILLGYPWKGRHAKQDFWLRHKRWDGLVSGSSNLLWPTPPPVSSRQDSHYNKMGLQSPPVCDLLPLVSQLMVLYHFYFERWSSAVSLLITKPKISKREPANIQKGIDKPGDKKKYELQQV